MRAENLARRRHQRECFIPAPHQRAAAQRIQGLPEPPGSDGVTEQQSHLMAGCGCDIGTGYQQRRDHGQGEGVEILACPGNRRQDPGAGGQYRRIGRNRYGQIRAGTQ